MGAVADTGNRYQGNLLPGYPAGKLHPFFIEQSERLATGAFPGYLRTKFVPGQFYPAAIFSIWFIKNLQHDRLTQNSALQQKTSFFNLIKFFLQSRLRFRLHISAMLQNVNKNVPISPCPALLKLSAMPPNKNSSERKGVAKRMQLSPRESPNRRSSRIRTGLNILLPESKVKSSTEIFNKKQSLQNKG